MDDRKSDPDARASSRDAFLAKSGWGAARRIPLAGDASFRHYLRLIDGDRRAILMDAPPAREPIAPFLAVARRLRSAGCQVPDIFVEDRTNGFCLLEDFGDDTFSRRLEAGDDPASLYEKAVDWLTAFHRLPPAALVADFPSYDRDRFLDEAALLVDWFCPALEEVPPLPAAARDTYLEAWTQSLAHDRAMPRTLVLRDFHVDNLMLVPPRRTPLAGGAPPDHQLGLLDFQDAVAGPVTYDVVSLLEDARRDVPAPVVAAMQARYLAAFPDLDPDAFRRSYAILGAQRHCKVIGIFTRLWRRDGKPAYLAHIDRVWGLLSPHLQRPELAPVRDWLDRYVPAGHRRRPDSPGQRS